MRDRPTDSYRRETEQRLGRKLGPDEVVDHLDEDKSNKSPLNLKVEDRGVHTAKHNQTRELGRLRKALTMVKRGEKLY
jgi:hypothetical protein